MQLQLVALLSVFTSIAAALPAGSPSSSEGCPRSSDAPGSITWSTAHNFGADGICATSVNLKSEYNGECQPMSGQWSNSIRSFRVDGKDTECQLYSKKDCTGQESEWIQQSDEGLGDLGALDKKVRAIICKW